MRDRPFLEDTMRDAVEDLLEALHVEPADETAWLALADALEEIGQPDRAELTRLTLRLRSTLEGPDRQRQELRMQELLAQGVGPCVPILENTVGMQFALIPPGRFLMGSPEDEAEREDDEAPLHEVAITRAFYLGVVPVTQEQYEKVMGSNPSDFEDNPTHPVETVTWGEAKDFCERLSAILEEKKRHRLYALPTEAQWEYACRAGTSSPFAFGGSLSSRQANFDGNHPYGGADKGTFLERTCKAGSYAPNAFGLYDTHGNVEEWCADWYARDYGDESQRTDPPGPSAGSTRVYRGGSWLDPSSKCRSARRGLRAPAGRENYLGFRVAMVVSAS
jgi:uncharacterized protein (TIGR02996 family)